MDTRYPEPLSNIYKRATKKKMHRGNGTRYRTQAITFSEIQEVDEENGNESESRRMGAERDGAGSGGFQKSKSTTDLTKSLEQLMPFSPMKQSRLEDTRLKNRYINRVINVSHPSYIDLDQSKDDPLDDPENPEVSPDDRASVLNLDESGKGQSRID